MSVRCKIRVSVFDDADECAVAYLCWKYNLLFWRDRGPGFYIACFAGLDSGQVPKYYHWISFRRVRTTAIDGLNTDRPYHVFIIANSNSTPFLLGACSPRP